MRSKKSTRWSTISSDESGFIKATSCCLSFVDAWGHGCYDASSLKSRLNALRDVSMENAMEDSMAQGEKTAVQASNATQNGGNNVVSLGPRDVLQGRLDIQGDLKVGGNVEGELKASGDVTIDPGATIQASVEGSNVTVRGQATANVPDGRLLPPAGPGIPNGHARVDRPTAEQDA